MNKSCVTRKLKTFLIFKTVSTFPIPINFVVRSNRLTITLRNLSELRLLDIFQNLFGKLRQIVSFCDLMFTELHLLQRQFIISTLDATAIYGIIDQWNFAFTPTSKTKVTKTTQYRHALGCVLTPTTHTLDYRY